MERILTNASRIINTFLQSLDRNSLRVSAVSISTTIQGPDDEVWAGLKSLFDQAGGRSEVNMVVTVSNAAD
ncbi:MAG: hypothetical protein K6T66_14075 [Peptococcaceae bacterium]|nr:hypothetical protein [Peptococcaceae bacterium]